MREMEQGVPCREVMLEMAVHTARWWARGHLTMATPVTAFRYFTAAAHKQRELKLYANVTFSNVCRCATELRVTSRLCIYR